MYFLFSGEGPTDLGSCSANAQTCEGAAYNHGPMTIVTDQIVESKNGRSFLDGDHYGYVSKRTLVARAKKLKAIRQEKKALRAPGKRKVQATRYFFKNARVLALIALEKEEELDEKVVAVLFRDSDGTASAGRGLWKDKWQSMLDGFTQEDFARGVPMIPKPTSEAWLICILQPIPYHDCGRLEGRSGSRRSPRPLKDELESILGERPTRTNLNEMVSDRTIDFRLIDMPSLTAFRERLKEVI